jgi:hypothetical protein
MNLSSQYGHGLLSGLAVDSGKSANPAASSVGSSSVKSLVELTVDEVCSLLTSLKMQEHEPSIRNHCVDGFMLCQLETVEELRVIDIELPLFKAKVFIARINEYKAKGVPVSLINRVLIEITRDMSTTDSIFATSSRLSFREPAVQKPTPGKLPINSTRIKKDIHRGVFKMMY